ncbi:5-formyltetrahydrofolate cyclo-ligase [Campylobacter sp. MIT 99-7217]|uniref:5-formyltetrahydrofolate cyclo-ligase n=1 Tax=Campylobacter sp. MIT 99-7217 TaxID=535091 RepID=UPI00115B8D69|nr:5-formyltetrahydrofolate cyclo-ligase [Campylobacter sp. MIT 99-7217]TQR33059.1 5-formyltetrahydrofolate cyclo-ligase [Campylobacter sp. MIT 99-7217]
MDKENFRKEQKQRLKNHAQKRFHFDFKIYKEITKIIKNTKSKNILIFIPLPYEPNLLRFRKNLSKNCILFVPFMQDKSLKMVKLRMPFKKGDFGVRQCANSFAKVKIDLAVVPVIGVDKNFKRIGHGKGFYDRFFAELSYEVKIIFIQSIDALTNQSLTQDHDIKADFYINPYKKYFKKELRYVNNTYCIYRRYHRRWDRIFSCQKDQ